METVEGNSFVSQPLESDLKVSLEYQVEIDGKPIFANCHPGFFEGTVAWVCFDFEKSVSVKITSLYDVDTVSVHPLSADVKAKLEDNVATFTIHEPGNYVVKWNDSFQLPVYIFANPKEVDVPSPEDPKVKYFGPGVHDAGCIQVESGETVYLAHGAWVHGQIQAEDAENIRICGRGVLSNQNIPFRRKGMKEVPWEVMGFRNCRNVEIEGIFVLDGYHWNVVLWHCDNVHINRLRIHAERLCSTDGINPCNSRNVLIENSFVRSKDDCISIKGTRKTYDTANAPIYNITVRSCVFWSDNNNGVVVGAETESDEIHNIAFEKIDLLRSRRTCGDYAGALSVIMFDDTKMHSIRFEDIRIEHASGPIFNFCVSKGFFAIVGKRRPEGSDMSGIEVKNVTIHDTFPLRRSYVKGLGPKHVVSGVSFEGITIGDRCVKTVEDMRLVCNEFVSDITIK